MSTITKTAVLTVDGVLQPKKLTHSMWTLHERLAKLPNVVAIHTNYRDNAVNMAARLAHELDVERIILTGHSKGGDFATDVAWDLKEYSAQVAGLVLADAWTLNGRITVPSNVERLWSYRQHNGRRGPWGSPIRLEDHRMTKWIASENDIPNVKHAQVDEYVYNLGIVWKLATEAAGLRVQEE